MAPQLLNSTDMILKIVCIAIQANVPIMIWGEPGEAKTSLLKAIGRVLDWLTIVRIGAYRDAVDFGGQPIMGPEGVDMLPLAWARQFSQERLGDEDALIILDEFNLAPDGVQKAMLSLINEGMVGDTPLGKNVRRIAIANPPEIANAAPLLPPMANRFFHLEWNMDIDFWIRGTLAGYKDPIVTKLPDNWKHNSWSGAAAQVTSFVAHFGRIRDRPQRDEAAAGKAWMSPRTLTKTIELIAAADSIKASEDIKAVLVEGMIGPGAAIEFMTFTKNLNLPHPADVLADPKRNAWYERKGDQLYAMLNAVVTYTLTHDTEKLWVPAWEVLVEASKKKMDVATSAGKTLAFGSLNEKEEYRWLAPECASVFYTTLNLANVAHEHKKPGKGRVA